MEHDSALDHRLVSTVPLRRLSQILARSQLCPGQRFRFLCCWLRMFQQYLRSWQFWFRSFYYALAARNSSSSGKILSHTLDCFRLRIRITWWVGTVSITVRLFTPGLRKHNAPGRHTSVSAADTDRTRFTRTLSALRRLLHAGLASTLRTLELYDFACLAVLSI
jgi:hypothetical protein